MLKVTDCTLRDGGYVNNHDFSKSQVTHTVSRLLAAGVDLVELGYFRRDTQALGLTAYCPPSLLESLPRTGASRLALMLRPDHVQPGHLAALRGYGISHVRIPARQDNLTASIALARAAREEGYVVCLNIIRASELSADQLTDIVRQVSLLIPDVLYFADSNGSMFPAQVEALIRFVNCRCDFPLGFHAHDNLNLAVANSIAAISGGACWIDSTLGGLGKGGGNAATEVMLTLVARLTGRKVSLASLLDIIAQHPGGLFPPRMRDRLQHNLWFAGL